MSQVVFKRGDFESIDKDIKFYNIRGRSEKISSSISYIKLQQFEKINSSVTRRRSLLDFSEKSKILFLCKGNTVFKLKPEEFISHALQYVPEYDVNERILFLVEGKKQITNLESFELNIEPFEIKLSPDEKRLACISKKDVLIYNLEEEGKIESIKAEQDSEFVSFSWHPDSEKILLAEKNLLSIYSQKNSNKETIYRIRADTNEKELSSVAWYVDMKKDREKVFMFLKNMELIEISPNRRNNTWTQKSRLSLKEKLLESEDLEDFEKEELGQKNISFNSRIIITKNLILIGIVSKVILTLLQIPFDAKEKTAYFYSSSREFEEQTNDEVQDGIFLEYNKNIGIIVLATSSGDDFEYFSKTKNYKYFVSLSIDESEARINRLELKTPPKTPPQTSSSQTSSSQTSSSQTSQTQSETIIKIIGVKFFGFQTRDKTILNVFAFVYETGELVFFLAGTKVKIEQGERPKLQDWQIRNLNLRVEVKKGQQTGEPMKQPQQTPPKETKEQQAQKIEVKKGTITESRAQEEKQLEQTQQSKTELEKAKGKQHTETEKESEKSKEQTKPEESEKSKEQRAKPEESEKTKEQQVGTEEESKKLQEQQAKPEESEKTKEQQVGTEEESKKLQEQQAKPEESEKTKEQQLETEEESKEPEEYQTRGEEKPKEESGEQYYTEVEEEPQVSGELKKPTKAKPDNNIVAKILIISFFLILIIALIVSFSSVSMENLLLVILKFILLIVFYILFVFFYEKIFMKGIQIKSRKPIKEED
jgi:hypothetical protein